MVISDFILGLLLLAAGKRLFWLSVGIIGFLAGAEFGVLLFPQNSGWLVLIGALVLGILGALFSVAFQWIAVILVGFVGGGYFIMKLYALILGGAQYNYWMFLAGGIAGILVITLVFDWALICISSLIGALLILRSQGISEPSHFGLFIAIAAAGILAQYLSAKFFK